MSKLGERIRKASRTEAARIGFGVGAARKASPTMLCLVRLAAGEAGKSADALAKGADAVILEGVEADKLKEQAQKAGAPPLGVRLTKADRAAVAAQRQAGADFVVLDVESAAGEAILEEGIGLVLALGRDISDTTLRVLGDLPLDALVVPPADANLTLGRLLELRRLSALPRMPLLMEVPATAAPSFLHTLREAGVAGVIVEGRALDRLPALREAIEALPPRGRRREERPSAVLPVSALAAAEEEDEEEEFS